MLPNIDNRTTNIVTSSALCTCYILVDFESTKLKLGFFKLFVKLIIYTN